MLWIAGTFQLQFDGIVFPNRGDHLALTREFECSEPVPPVRGCCRRYGRSPVIVATIDMGDANKLKNDKKSENYIAIKVAKLVISPAE